MGCQKQSKYRSAEGENGFLKGDRVRPVEVTIPRINGAVFAKVQPCVAFFQVCL